MAAQLALTLLLANAVLGDVTPGASQLNSSTTLKLARTYSGNNFFSGFDFFTAADPTNGYVNYVSYDNAQSLGLATIGADGSVIMRADAENVATGRGRNSVRITSKDQWADGVYILDLNHMPVGCGTWPAFWTTVTNGWPSGGEIDIIEGANALPARNSAAYNATKPSSPLDSFSAGQNVGSLHIAGTCPLPVNYQLGTLGSNTCQATINGNTGCGVLMGGNATYGVDSFGSGFNAVGGYFAMWRDFANSGGAYMWYWPRGSSHLPADVSFRDSHAEGQNPNTTATNVAGWGQPSANLSIPACKSDFGKHAIVFNLAFCGDYANPTFAASGCPGTCTTFVMNNPSAFSEAYWSIRSLRIYTASGEPAAAANSGLSKGATAGVAVGAVIGGLLLLGLGWFCWRKRRNQRAPAQRIDSEQDDTPKAYTLVQHPRSTRSGNGGKTSNSTPTPSPPLQSGGFIPYLSADETYASDDNKDTPTASGRNTPINSTPRSKGTIQRTADGKRIVNLLPKNPKGNLQWNGYNREGKTVLAPGRSARHYLAGETPLGGGGPASASTTSFGAPSYAQSRNSMAVSVDDLSVVPDGSRRASTSMSVLAGGGVGGSRRGSTAIAPPSPAGGSRRGSTGVALSGQGGGDWVKLAQSKQHSSISGGGGGWAG